MMRRIIIAAWVALLVSGARADAQDPRLARKLDPQTLAAVEAIIDSARATGIPTEPLADKAMYAAFRKATSEQIIASVRTRAMQLGVAKRVLSPATDQALLAGADALANGVSEATLIQLRRVRTAGDLAIPLSVLADLVARGAQIDTASMVVIALASSNMRDTDMIKFRQTVERDIALGSLPAASVATRAEAAGVDLLSSAPTNGPGRAPIVPGPKPPIKP